jgi:hypothetical protein
MGLKKHFTTPVTFAQEAKQQIKRIVYGLQ